MEHIYFLQTVAPIEGAHKVKIGVSKDPHRRLAYFSSHSPVRVEIVASMPGSKSLLQKLVRRFSSSLSHGMWFTLTDDLSEYIAAVRGANDVVPYAAASDALALNGINIEDLIGSGTLTLLYSQGGHRRVSRKELNSIATEGWFPV